MLYLISDIHGDVMSFRKMLKKISFDPAVDHMIVMGDIFDWNDEGISLLEFMSDYLVDGSMQLIKGNHELFAQMYIEGSMSEIQWIIFGGGGTIRDIKKLNVDDQMKLHGFLAHLPHYTEIHSPKYGVCVVTHPGIHCGSYIRNADRTINITESITNAVRRDEYRFLISPDIHNVPFSDKKAFDRYVFCGHVTTNRLNEDHSYNAYVTPYYMDLDCGNGERNRGGKLACYCVDENSAIYV
jgi:Calcineurin-like phosphoesterase.